MEETGSDFCECSTDIIGAHDLLRLLQQNDVIK
jgi:hypothetical protein